MNAELTCNQCCDLLPEFAAGAMSASESDAIASHLAHCAACRQELAQWRAMVEMTRRAEALVAAGDLTAPSALWSVVQQRMTAQSSVVTGERFMEFDQQPSEVDLGVSRITPSRLERDPQWRTGIVAIVAAVLLIALAATVFALRPLQRSAPNPAGSTNGSLACTVQSTQPSGNSVGFHYSLTCTVTGPEGATAYTLMGSLSLSPVDATPSPTGDRFQWCPNAALSTGKATCQGSFFLPSPLPPYPALTVTAIFSPGGRQVKTTVAIPASQ